MIDFKISGRDLEQTPYNDIKKIKDMEAKKQIILNRLTIRLGSFIYDEALGSRLYLLLREKPSNVNEKANLYVREALESEEDLTVERVEVKWLDKKKILILVFFSWNEVSDKVEVMI